MSVMLVVVDYDDIVLQISHDNNIETIQLESPDGELELCCYPDYVRVTIRVFITEFENVTGPDCPADECKKIVEMEYINQLESDELVVVVQMSVWQYQYSYRYKSAENQHCE